MVPQREQVSLFRSLATLLSAGVPIFEIFHFLSEQVEDPRAAAACQRIADRLTRGQSLPAAATKEPEVFDPTVVRLLEVGCQTGKLCAVLDRLAREREENWRTQQQLKAQLAYPLGIALVTLLAVVLLPPLVLTDLLNQITAFTGEPPALTRALLRLSEAVTSPFFFCLLGLTGLGLRRWANLNRLEAFALRAPALSTIYRNVMAVRFLRTFALAYECGIPVTEALSLSAGATGSPSLERSGSAMKKRLVGGASLPETMAVSGFLPPLALESVEVGQQTGKLGPMLDNVARILATELESQAEAATKLVEPIILSCLGLFAAVFALGCLLPIIRLAERL